MSWHCSECHSKEVQILDWVSPNTGESDENNDITTTDTWCKVCQEHNLGIDWFGKGEATDD